MLFLRLGDQSRALEKFSCRHRHDLSGMEHAFERAMETYDALAELQEKDPRLRIHSISTATDVNMEEIPRLTRFLYDRCPKMDHELGLAGPWS